MKPTKRKPIVEKLSKQLGISEEDVDDIIYYYYKFVGTLVESLEHNRIYIPKVGNLVYRDYQGLKVTRINENFINSGDPSCLVKKISMEEAIELVAKLKKLTANAEALKKRANELKKQKYESNRDMEE